jgi:glutamate N-acetyltransferase/amino-acid N-acetyltransferase
MLSVAVDRSFHRISVDGDTSTNDAVLVLSRTVRGEPRIDEQHPARAALEEALGQVCRHLAEQIVADGEGASKVLRIEVQGAPSDEAARRVAEAVARSLLVKTAVAGRDPNWGRIIAVAGNAGVPIDPSRVELVLGGVPVFERGTPRVLSAAEGKELFREDVVTATLQLGAGEGTAVMLTTDLTHEYVRINAEYTT